MMYLARRRAAAVEKTGEVDESDAGEAEGGDEALVGDE